MGPSQNSILVFSADYQFLSVNYKESEGAKINGEFPAARGQIKLNLLSWFSLSAGGSYYDGHMFYEGPLFGGAEVKQTTVDVFRDVRYLGHFRLGNMDVALGQAERWWLNDVLGSYKRYSEYKYNPVILTYYGSPFYSQVEYRIWNEGTNLSTMEKVNASANNVTFIQDKGSGYAFEMGMMFPFGPFLNRIYFAYDFWSVDMSDTKNDGTQDLVIPKNTTKTYIFGMGFSF